MRTHVQRDSISAQSMRARVAQGGAHWADAMNMAPAAHRIALREDLLQQVPVANRAVDILVELIVSMQESFDAQLLLSSYQEAETNLQKLSKVFEAGSLEKRMLTPVIESLSWQMKFLKTADGEGLHFWQPYLLQTVSDEIALLADKACCIASDRRAESRFQQLGFAMNDVFDDTGYWTKERFRISYPYISAFEALEALGGDLHCIKTMLAHQAESSGLFTLSQGLLAHAQNLDFIPSNFRENLYRLCEALRTKSPDKVAPLLEALRDQHHEIQARFPGPILSYDSRRRDAWKLIRIGDISGKMPISDRLLDDMVALQKRRLIDVENEDPQNGLWEIDDKAALRSYFARHSALAYLLVDKAGVLQGASLLCSKEENFPKLGQEAQRLLQADFAGLEGQAAEQACAAGLLAPEKRVLHYQHLFLLSRDIQSTVAGKALQQATERGAWLLSKERSPVLFGACRSSPARNLAKQFFLRAGWIEVGELQSGTPHFSVGGFPAWSAGDKQEAYDPRLVGSAA